MFINAAVEHAPSTFSSPLKMEAAHLPETSTNFQQTCHIPEHSAVWGKFSFNKFRVCLQKHRRNFENQKACVVSRGSYEGHLESKERFAIKKYLLIIGKKKNMQVLSHTFTYFYT